MVNIPLWRQIETVLTEEILSGQHRPGEKLPTEATLSGRFEVNRHTVRRALSAMAENGLVRPLRGSGVYVAPRPIQLPFDPTSDLPARLAEMGHRIERRILGLSRRGASLREAAALEMEGQGEVTLCDSLCLADGEPLYLSNDVICSTAVPDLSAQLQRGIPLPTAVEEASGGALRWQWDGVFARDASADQARGLYLREGAATLVLTARVRAPQGALVALCETICAAERLALTFPV